MYVFDCFVVRDPIAGNAGRVEVGMDIDAQVGFKIGVISSDASLGIGQGASLFICMTREMR